MCKEIINAKKKAREIIYKLKMYDKVDLDDVIEYLEKKIGCQINTIRFDFTDFAKELEMEEFSYAGGYVLKQKDTYTIAINSNHPKEFQRFAIAHELGHIVLNHMNKEDRLLSFLINYNLTDIPYDIYKEDEYLLKEQAANAFALELLVPVLPEEKSNYQIERLAYKYNVSEEAIIARIRNRNC